MGCQQRALASEILVLWNQRDPQKLLQHFSPGKDAPEKIALKAERAAEWRASFPEIT